MSVVLYNFGFLLFLLAGTIVTLTLPGNPPVMEVLGKNASKEAIDAAKEVYEELAKDYGSRQGVGVLYFLRLKSFFVISSLSQLF